MKKIKKRRETDKDEKITEIPWGNLQTLANQVNRRTTTLFNSANLFDLSNLFFRDSNKRVGFWKDNRNTLR